MTKVLNIILYDQGGEECSFNSNRKELKFFEEINKISSQFKLQNILKESSQSFGKKGNRK